MRNKKVKTHKLTRLSSAIGMVICGASLNAEAALTSSASLTLTGGGTNLTCPYGTGTFPGPNGCSYESTDVSSTGSWFAVDGNGDGSVAQSEIYLMTLAGTGAIHLGTTSTATGSHTGSINGTENPAFNIWEFFSNTGMHYVSSPISEVGTHAGSTAQLDFSGWTITWSGIPAIDLGGGSQDCGTTSDGICGTGAGDIGGTFDNGSGLATITCSQVSCSDSSTFYLDYEAKFKLDDPSGYGGATYFAHLEGSISSAAVVPIPAAGWLFGSGLVGLVSLARKKKRPTPSA